MAMRSFLKSDEAGAGTGGRYLGVPMLTSKVRPEQLEQTRKFASALADRLFGERPARPRDETPQPR